MPSAIGIQSAVFNGASIVVRSAGLLYIPIGIAGLLAVNAVSFAAIIVALALMRPLPPVGSHAVSLLESVLEGGRYVRKNPTLVWVLVIAGTMFSTVGPVGQLLPAVAGESLYNGVSWLSLLLTALGLGAFTARFGDERRALRRRPGRCSSPARS